MNETQRKETQLITFGKLQAFYIDYLLSMRKPEVHEDFSDYPYDFPSQLRYNPSVSSYLEESFLKKVSTSDKEAKMEKISSKIVKKNKNPNTVIKLEKEANEFIGKSISEVIGEKRKTRFTGSYLKGEEIHKEPLKVSSSDSSSSSCSSDSSNSESTDEDEFVFFVDPDVLPNSESTNKIKIKLKNSKKLVKTLSDSSSSDEEEESTRQTKVPQNLFSEIRGKRFYDYSSSNSSSDEEVNCKESLSSHNSDSSLHVKDQVVKIPNGQNQISKTFEKFKGIKNKFGDFLEKQKSSQINKLKSAFALSNSFDDAMKLYESKKNKTNRIGPPVIQPPLHDPMNKQKQKNKVTQNKISPRNSNEHLGGIFTVNNGWDKDPNLQSKEEDIKLVKRSGIDEADRKIEQPPLHMLNYDRDLEDQDLINKSYDYRVNYLNVKMNENNLSDTYDSDEDDVSNLVIDEENAGEITSNATLNLTLGDSIGQTNENCCNQDHENTVQNLHTSEKEENKDNLPEELHNNEQLYDDDCAISLAADLGTLDDLIDFEQPELVTDLDGLKIKIKLQNNTETDTKIQDEFDKNTEQIAENAVDLKIAKTLRDYFGDVCPAFLENRCTFKVCSKHHQLIDPSTLRAILVRTSTYQMREEVIPVVMRFYKLFHTYVSVLTEKFVNNNDELSLINLVKGCDCHPRTKECLRDIVRKVIDMGHWKVHKAIRFVIEHHIDSSIARNTIFHMILDSGPCMPYFMDYIEFIYNKQTILDQEFDRILHACVAYQNPRLPNFCLNYLQQCPRERIIRLHNENLKAFFQFNRCVSELNECREAKLLSILDKMQGQ